MIKAISNTRKSDVCAQIVQNESKILLIPNKSTFVSKKLCLILYLRTIVDKAESLQNIFLQSVKLSDQVAKVICDPMLKILKNSCIDNAFLQRNLASFCSDGASVMLGKTSGVSTGLKSNFPNLLLWHCFNHQLKLAVGDSIKSVDGFYHT